MTASTRSVLLGFLAVLAAGGELRAGTADFNLVNSRVVLSGDWEQSTTGGRLSVGGSNGSQLDASIVGTSVVLTCYSTAATSITVTVDGTSSTPTFPAVNAWTTLQIDLGEAGTHSLTIKQPYLGASFYLDTGTGSVSGPTFSVVGPTPAIGPPTTGFGPQYQLNDPVNVTPYIQAEGGLTQVDDGAYPNIYHNLTGFTDEALYFTATATGTIQGWIYGGGGELGLYVDGVKTSVLYVPRTNTYNWITLFTGDGSPHHYGLSQAYAGTIGLSIWSLMTVGGELIPVALPARPRLIAYGDSITQAQVGGHDDSSRAYAEEIGVSLGLAVYNRGIAGTTVHEFPTGADYFTTESGEARTQDVTSVADTAKGLIILYGTNDMGQKMGGDESIADFQVSYQNMLASIVPSLPATSIIVCIGILPRTDFSPFTIAAWNTGIQTAIAAVGAPNVIYADPSGWGLLQNNGDDAPYSDVAGNTIDGLHPDPAGYSIIVSHVLPYFTLPTVTAMIAGDGMAVEGGEKGKVIVRRTGDTSADLAVLYKVKGSAKANVDYKATSGVVTIPAGSAQAKIKIKPLDDANADGTRIAKVKLLPSTDGSYNLGSDTTAKIKVIDNQ